MSVGFYSQLFAAHPEPRLAIASGRLRLPGCGLPNSSGSRMSTASDLPSLFRAESLAEQAYRAIREGIATGLFQAGERVTERGLATRLNVSATPVREALRLLEQEGLIERVSARQPRVVDHSSGTLRELLLTGAALRAMEARFATHKTTDAALDRMAALVEALASELKMDTSE